MSKPNLLAFSSSIGIYRNKRIRDLRRLLSKSIRAKVDFCELSPMLFQVVMAYAAENQIDGDFSGYTRDDWRLIFAGNNVDVDADQAAIIIKSFHEVGLFEKDKIRSWMRYNRHLADYEGILKAKRKAAKMMHKKWHQQAKESLNNSHGDPSKNGEKPAPKPVQKDSPSKQLWLLENALKTAKGKARKELLKQKQDLLSQTTGVDLSEPAPSPALPLPKSRNRSPAEIAHDNLLLAKQTLEDWPEGLTDGLVTALVQAGHTLPANVRSKFAKLIAQLGSDQNPVPE